MLPLYIYYFASATGKDFFSFLAENNNQKKKKNAFTWNSCFQSPGSTCRTLSSCYKIGFCFTNNQSSVLDLWVRLLQWRYGKPVCFSSHDKPRFPVLGVLPDFSSFPVLDLGMVLTRALPYPVMDILES